MASDLLDSPVVMERGALSSQAPTTWRQQERGLRCLKPKILLFSSLNPKNYNGYPVLTKALLHQQLLDLCSSGLIYMLKRISQLRSLVAA